MSQHPQAPLDTHDEGQETYYRPPSEEDSFIIRVMHGCPHNKCTFCNLFKSTTFRVVPLEDVLAGIDRDAEELGARFSPLLKSMYLEGGDPLALPSAHLLRIMHHAKQRFPALGRFACYATARSVLRKTRDELIALGAAGLQRIFVGLESGCDPILEATRKGCTTADLRQVGPRLAGSGIELDVSLMLGIGGAALSERHATETASVLNDLAPACVRLRTFVPKVGTDLGVEYASGGFVLQGPHDILRELRLMVSHITAPMLLRSEHWTNFVHFDAPMPEAREALLALLDENLAKPESVFRPVGLCDDKA